MRRAAAIVLAGALLAGCGSSGTPKATTTTAATAAGNALPRLDFAYEKTPLAYVDHGRINKTSYPIAIDNISYASQGAAIDGFLLLPPGGGKHAAVIIVPGGGGDRTQLLTQAAWLAARNVVTLTITAPSSLQTSTPTTISGLLSQAKSLTVHDVVAIRRAVDLLQSLPQVDPNRIGYLGWSDGAKTGSYIAASEPRVKALALLSAGADKLSAFVANAPASDKAQVKRVLGSVDPLRYIAVARPGSVLLEDGRKDTVDPRAALLNIAHAAPKGTLLRWFDAPHALNNAAYGAAFDWLGTKLGFSGPTVKGATTENG
jgi:dienelactone hydrolase